jgi:hypothetical protein
MLPGVYSLRLGWRNDWCNIITIGVISSRDNQPSVYGWVIVGHGDEKRSL